MEYLIQNRKEFIITCGVFATIAIVIFRAIWATIHGEFSAENVRELIAAVFEILGWYYNMPTSEENNRHTAEMRQEKAEKYPDYEGERFFSEEDIVEDDEDDEYDEEAEEEVKDEE